jgi:hypothetical protein
MVQTKEMTMKTFIAILIMVSPMLVFASETCSTSSGAETVEETKEITTDVPAHLKGATIIVRTADGKETSVPAEKFKVVPRKQQFLVTKTKQTDKTMCSTDPAKNRVSLLAGNGPKEGLDRSKTATTVTVESRTGAVGGLQYQRLTDLKVLGMPLSVGGQLQTNESALVNVGLDF